MNAPLQPESLLPLDDNGVTLRSMRIAAALPEGQATQELTELVHSHQLLQRMAYVAVDDAVKLRQRHDARGVELERLTAEVAVKRAGLCRLLELIDRQRKIDEHSPAARNLEQRALDQELEQVRRAAS